MKVECPYCWQHYEVEKSDLNGELECINCEQTFRVRDALIVENQSAGRRIMLWGIGIMSGLIVLLIAVNIWCWFRFVHVPETAEPPAAAEKSGPVQEDLQTVIAPLFKSLKELRAELDLQSKSRKELEEQLRQLTRKQAAAEKKLVSVVGIARISAMEEELKTLQLKPESGNARIQLMEETGRDAERRLQELRNEYKTLDVSDRLTALERKIDKLDMNAIQAKLSVLEQKIKYLLQRSRFE